MLLQLLKWKNLIEYMNIMSSTTFSSLCHRGNPRHTYYTHKKYSHLRPCDELRHKELEESEERNI